MTKRAKATDKVAVRKPAKKSSGKTKKPKDLAEARKDITEIVRAEAALMAKAVVVEARKGQLPHMKYLFEVSGLYPANLGAEAKPGEDSLALTLLKRMGLPLEPAKSPEDEAPVKPGGGASSSSDEESGEENSGGLTPQEEDGEREAGATEARDITVVLS